MLCVKCVFGGGGWGSSAPPVTIVCMLVCELVQLSSVVHAYQKPSCTARVNAHVFALVTHTVVHAMRYGGSK